MSVHLSDRRVLILGSFTRAIRYVVVPSGVTWEVTTFTGQAAYNSSVQVYLAWDYGETGEEVIAATHGDLIGARLDRQLTGDGVKKLALVLENMTGVEQAVGASWDGKNITDSSGLPTPTNSQAALVKVDKVIEGNVGPGSTEIDELGTPIPSGEIWRVKKFGGSEVGDGNGKASVIAFQVADDGSTWVTVRGFGLVSTGFEVEIDRDFVGDGTRKLRVIRQNNDTTSKKIVAWVTGVKF